LSFNNHNKNTYYSVPLRKSLRFRLTIVNLSVAFLLGVIMLCIASKAVDRRMETEYIAKGNAVASTVACMVNGEMVDRYLSTLERDAEYEAILSDFCTMQREHGLLYVLVIKMVEDGEIFVFSTGEVERKTNALGVFVTWVDSFGEGHEDYIDALLHGERVGILISKGVYGHILSSYIPIYRNDGSVAAYACVDISMDQLKREERGLFLLAGMGMVSILVLTITACLFAFQRYILSPLNILLDQAASVHAVGKGFAHKAPLQVRLKSGDELAVLEQAIIDTELRIRAEVVERLLEEESYRSSIEEQLERLSRLFNGLDEYICATIPETGEILFINDNIKKAFGIEGDGLGRHCYELFQSNAAGRCDFCPSRQLEKDPERIIEWEQQHGSRMYRKTARIMDWPGGIKAHLEVGVDITDIKLAQLEAEYHTKITETLNNMAVMLLSYDEEPFEYTMTKGVGVIADMVNMDRVTIWQNMFKGGDLYGVQVFGWDRKDGITTRSSAQLIQFKLAECVPRWEKILSSDGVINGPVRLLPEVSLLQSFGCVSVFITPIFIKKEFSGFVMFEDRYRERVFTDSEADILRTASLMISSTVTRYEETEKARKAEERVKLMLDATPLGCQIIDHNLVTIDCNEAAVKLFGFSNKQEFIERWLNYCNPEFQPDGQRSDEKRFILRKKAIEEGSCVFEWMHQTRDGTSFPTEITLTRVEYENNFVLVRYTRDLREIKKMAEDVQYLKTEAKKIYLDPLTNIYNRRYLDENLKRVLSSLSRSNAALSVMMIDIDHFKKYNDTYGHTKGDDCLKAIASTLESSMSRADDFVVRYGGEEFTIVLPNTEERGAHLMAGKLLNNVRNLAIPHETSDAASYITISIGVISGIVKHTHSADYWIGLADEMLYKSKREGRDRYNFMSADGT